LKKGLQILDLLKEKYCLKLTNIFIFTRQKNVERTIQEGEKIKGRQTVPIPIEKEKPLFGNVALVKEKVQKQKRKIGRKLGNY
jgi:hypothetical protein